MNEKEKVIAFITKQQSVRFRVVDNTGSEKKLVAGQFPDVLLLQKEPPPNTNILYVLKIETGASVADKLPEWKTLGDTPSVFYLVVKKEQLDDAKRIANSAGARAKFAWYEMSGENVSQVRYE